MLGGDGPQLLVGGIGRGAVVDLDGAERLHLLAEPELAAAGDAHVAHPLGLTPGRHEVLLAVKGEQVHRRGAPLAALAAAHGERPRAPNADAEPGQPLDAAVEDVLGEPARLFVVPCHRLIMAVGDWTARRRPTTLEPCGCCWRSPWALERCW